MGNRRMGRRRMDSLLERNYDKDDEWGYIRPPMVPGLQRNLRVIALGEMHGFGFEDSEDLPADGTTTSTWVREDENSAAIALVGNDDDFTDGCMSLTAGSATDDAVGFGSANADLLTCTSGKKFWCETSFKVGDYDNCEFFFGLAEAAFGHGTNFGTVSAGGSADKIGFKKATHNSGAITTTSSLNTAEQTPGGDVLTLTANNDVVTLGIYWDGVSTVRFYGGLAATGTEVGALPLLASATTYPDVALGLMLQVVSTGGSMVTLVNYIRACWEI